jgi:hypothetical protein
MKNITVRIGWLRAAVMGPNDGTVVRTSGDHPEKAVEKHRLELRPPSLAENPVGRCASPANSRGYVDVRIMYNQRTLEGSSDSAARNMHGEGR